MTHFPIPPLDPFDTMLTPPIVNGGDAMPPVVLPLTDLT